MTDYYRDEEQPLGRHDGLLQNGRTIFGLSWQIATEMKNYVWIFMTDCYRVERQSLGCHDGLLQRWKTIFGLSWRIATEMKDYVWIAMTDCYRDEGQSLARHDGFYRTEGQSLGRQDGSPQSERTHSLACLSCDKMNGFLGIWRLLSFGRMAHCCPGYGRSFKTVVL